MTAAKVEVVYSVVVLLVSLVSLIYSVSNVVGAITTFGSFKACWDCLDLGEKFLFGIWLLIVMVAVLVFVLNVLRLITLLA